MALPSCEKPTPTNYDHLYHNLQQQFRGQLHFLYALNETDFNYIQNSPYFNYQDLPKQAKEGVNCFTQLRFQTINQQLQYQSAFDEDRLQNDLLKLLEEYRTKRPIPIQTNDCLYPCWQSNFHCIAKEMIHLTIHGINIPNGEFFRSTFKTLNHPICNQGFRTCTEACEDG
ncbi:MAG: hypothetical protein AAF599_02730 [Bacteroidota bacterium]